MKIVLVVACLSAFLSLDAQAVAVRSQHEKAVFAKQHPCPSTKRRVPSCKGYVIDHIIPLCGGGPDKAANMQWQTVKDGLAKDARERRYCICLKKSPTQACTL